MKSAVTLCQVPEAAAGPFVFHGPLAEGFENAARLGFDAVELFLSGPEDFHLAEIQELQQRHSLAIAAVGTGAGMLKHGLSLTDPDPGRRQAALEFIRSMIDLGGRLQAPVILGSMQGKWAGDVSRDQALDWLATAVGICGSAAASHAQPFLYEPLNRYETNLMNRLGEAADWIRSCGAENIALLADLFHMNLEEPDLPAAIMAGGELIAHVHYADSNRHAMGFAHTDPAPVIAALKQIRYSGFLSAEIFPLPDSETAATQTIQSIKSQIS
jgi:sugar phosphate isomerase/epimerase